jgi:DNA-directed RNA polymerase subunit RPC12/RpoP
MSEYKYACPVCGQHMMCDSSQAGTVMECPTCFQKITAPQAPAAGDGQKFVLTGTKVGDRPAPKFATAGPAVVIVGNSSPMRVVLVVLVLIGLLGAGAAVFAFRGKLFQHTTAADAGGQTQAASPKTVPIHLPPASDTNWMLSLEGVTIPDSPAAGRIHGQDFLAERASFSTNGMLTIRAGTRGAVDFGLTVNFNGAAVESLAGQTINVTTNAEKAARLTLRWRDGSQALRDSFDGGYALRLEFGALANNRIPGKIYFCAPDDLKSYVMGTFNLEIRRPRPPKPKP